MDISALTSPTEAALIAVFVASLTQNLKQTKLPNAALPWVAALIGAVAGLVAAYATGSQDFGNAAIAGFFTALATSGAVDGLKSAKTGASSAVSAIASALTKTKVDATSVAAPVAPVATSASAAPEVQSQDAVPAVQSQVAATPNVQSQVD